MPQYVSGCRWLCWVDLMGCGSMCELCLDRLGDSRNASSITYSLHESEMLPGGYGPLPLARVRRGPGAGSAWGRGMSARGTESFQFPTHLESIA